MNKRKRGCRCSLSLHLGSAAQTCQNGGSHPKTVFWTARSSHPPRAGPTCRHVSKGLAGRLTSAARWKPTCGAASITAQLETPVACPVSNQAATAAFVQAWNGSTAASFEAAIAAQLKTPVACPVSNQAATAANIQAWHGSTAAACAAEAHADAVTVSVQARHGGTEASSAIEREEQATPVASANPQACRKGRKRKGLRLVAFSFAGSATQFDRRACIELRIHRRWRF